MPSSNQRDVATATQQTEPQVQTTAPQREDALGSSVEDPIATEKSDTKEERQRRSKENLEKARAARQAEGFDPLNPKDWRGNLGSLGKEPTDAQKRGLGEEKLVRDLSSEANATDNGKVDGSSLWNGLEAAWDSLEDRLAGKTIERDLIAGGNAGEKLAEDMVHSETEALQNATEKSTENLIMNAVNLTNYAVAASKDVLATAENGGLSPEDMWSVVTIGSNFMKHIKKGMKINKVIPDSAAGDILNVGKMSTQYNNNNIGGSVGNAHNYTGLSGADAISVLGLDYGGTTDVKDGQNVYARQKWQSTEVETVQQNDPYNQLSSYVRQTAEDSGKVEVSQDYVFFVSFDMPEEQVQNVKVPVHQSIITWAQNQLQQIQEIKKMKPEDALNTMLDLGLPLRPEELMGTLAGKEDTLNLFLSKATSKAPLAKLGDPSKSNTQDPFTGTGMTQPGSRLTSPLITINQEYMLDTNFPLPAGSGLFVKDGNGTDHELLSMIKEDDSNDPVWDLGKKQEAIVKLMNLGINVS